MSRVMLLEVHNDKLSSSALRSSALKRRPPRSSFCKSRSKVSNGCQRFSLESVDSCESMEMCR